jgi:hypothetical protein
VLIRSLWKMIRVLPKWDVLIRGDKAETNI